MQELHLLGHKYDKRKIGILGEKKLKLEMVCLCFAMRLRTLKALMLTAVAVFVTHQGTDVQ